MKTVKTHHLILALILIITTGIFAAGIYLLGWYLPAQSYRLFGPPAADLSRPYQILYAARLFSHKDFLLENTGNDQSQSVFTVQQHEPVSSIAARLYAGGFIDSPDVWKEYLVYSGIDRKIQSGTYLLSRNLTPVEIAAVIHDDNPEDVNFAFLPGWRSEEIAALFPNSGLAVDNEEFLELISKPELSEVAFLKGFSSLEGFLYPGTYQLDRASQAEQIISQFVGRFFDDLPPDFEEKVHGMNLNLHEAVILASIIQKETVIPEEAPMIASVFINRLNAGMPLQSDPTVQYALGYSENHTSWWKSPLTTQDLQIESPFNTYIHSGLPPAAISNPDMNSLNAVANPAHTDYYYFRSDCDQSGRHNFSKTYEAHLQAACPP